MSENIRKAITLVNSCSYIVTAKKAARNELSPESETLSGDSSEAAC